jgi:hypothetical protein
MGNGGYFPKFVSLEVVPYTDGIELSTLQLARDIPQKYLTAISYEGKSVFRENLIA